MDEEAGWRKVYNLAEQAKRFEIKNPAIDAVVYVLPDFYGLGAALKITVQLMVPNRDGGGKIKVAMSERMHADQIDGIDHLFEVMRDMVINAFRHEALECLHVDGHRKWDPHTG